MPQTQEKRFFLHRLGKSYLSVDVTGLGPRVKSFPCKHHSSWSALQRYLLGLGAFPEVVTKCYRQLRRTRFYDLPISQQVE